MTDAIIVLVDLILIAATVYGTWRVFEKAGKVGFTSIVPMVREIEFLEIVNRPWWWIFPLICTYSGLIGFVMQRSVAPDMELGLLFMILTIIGAIFWFILMIDVAKAFGKGAGYGVALFFLPFVFFPHLALTGEYQIEQDPEQKMKPLAIKIINGGLLILTIYLAMQLYYTVMEPITFERIKFERYCAVTERLEQIREAQLAYKTEYGDYTGDMDVLVAFVDTGKITIYERKDSSYMAYNKLYQKDMEKDTVVVRILGTKPVNSLYGEGFDGNTLRTVPFTDGEEFTMAAGKVKRAGVIVPVFEVYVPEKVVFADLNKRFDQYIDKSHDIKIGSLTEASISGNYENTQCKTREN